MDHYTGFHEWKSKLEDGIVSWKGLYSVLQQVPDVLEKMGMKVSFSGMYKQHIG